MALLNKIIQWFKKNPCKECDFYIASNNTCVSRKCGGAVPYISFFDKLFCSPYKETDRMTLDEWEERCWESEMNQIF